MARLLVLWTRPHHLSEGEAEAWACASLRQLLALDGVARGRLTRLASTPGRHLRPWDWLLELELPADGDLEACVASAGWREWLGDLRLLGMQPAAMVADGGHELDREAD